MDRVCIFIDAGNFYHLALRRLGLHEADFDFDGFATFLANGREIAREGKRFYVGTVREIQDGHENKQAMVNQTSLFRELIERGGWEIKTSKLRTRVEKIKIDNRVVDHERLQKMGLQEISYVRSREKGIDVKLATDIIVGAIDKKYDVAIVVSSDADLVPAIDWVRMRLKKKVEYIGFSMPATATDADDAIKPTKTMIYRTDIQRVLVESDIRPFTKTLFAKK
ncbi:MAG: NYN domain-containing protein [Patescibacteria group bacterium]